MLLRIHSCFTAAACSSRTWNRQKDNIRNGPRAGNTGEDKTLGLQYCLCFVLIWFQHMMWLCSRHRRHLYHLVVGFFSSAENANKVKYCVGKNTVPNLIHPCNHGDMVNLFLLLSFLLPCLFLQCSHRMVPNRRAQLWLFLLMVWLPVEQLHNMCLLMWGVRVDSWKVKFSILNGSLFHVNTGDIIQEDFQM